jgi:hypothetical protein
MRFRHAERDDYNVTKGTPIFQLASRFSSAYLAGMVKAG